MKARRLENGNLLVPKSVPLPKSNGIVDVMVEIGPGDPDFNNWEKWLSQYNSVEKNKEGSKLSLPNVTDKESAEPKMNLQALKRKYSRTPETTRNTVFGDAIAGKERFMKKPKPRKGPRPLPGRTVENSHLGSAGEKALSSTEQDIRKARQEYARAQESGQGVGSARAGWRGAQLRNARREYGAAQEGGGDVAAAKRGYERAQAQHGEAAQSGRAFAGGGEKIPLPGTNGTTQGSGGKGQPCGPGEHGTGCITAAGKVSGPVAPQIQGGLAQRNGHSPRNEAQKTERAERPAPKFNVSPEEFEKLPEDNKLAVKAAKGDKQAMNDMLGRLYPRIQRRLSQYGNNQDAEDAVQNAFVKLEQHIGEFDPKKNLFNYAMQYARRALMDIQRATGRRGGAGKGEDPDDRLESGSRRVSMGERASESPGPEEEAMEKEQDAKVDAAIRVLPEDQRMAILMRRSGAEVRDVAERLKVKEQRVYQLLRNAEGALREKLAERGGKDLSILLVKAFGYFGYKELGDVQQKDLEPTIKSLSLRAFHKAHKTEKDKDTSPKHQAAVILGREGGKEGGSARAEALSGRRRREIAKKGAEARWRKERTPTKRPKLYEHD